MCLADTPAATRAALLPCGHSDFCAACAVRWTTTVLPTCPLCKAPVARLVRHAPGAAAPTALETLDCAAAAAAAAAKTGKGDDSDDDRDSAPDLSCLDSTFFVPELAKLQAAASAAAAALCAAHAAPVAVRRARAIAAEADFWRVFVARSDAAPAYLLEHSGALARRIACRADELAVLRARDGCRVSPRVAALDARERAADAAALAAMRPEDSAYCYRVTHPPAAHTLLDAFLAPADSRNTRHRSRRNRRPKRQWQGDDNDAVF